MSDSRSVPVQRFEQSGRGGNLEGPEADGRLRADRFDSPGFFRDQTDWFQTEKLFQSF